MQTQGEEYIWTWDLDKHLYIFGFKVNALVDCLAALPGSFLEKSADMLDRYHDALFNYTAFPRQYWRRLRTTNMLERVNLEMKRRTRKVGAFPGEQSLLRLAVSILMDINEEGVTGRKYLSLEES